MRFYRRTDKMNTVIKQQDVLTVLEETAQALKASAEAVGGTTEYDNERLLGYYEA